MNIRNIFFPVLACIFASQAQATNQEDENALKARYEALQRKRINEARQMQNFLLEQIQEKDTADLNTKNSQKHKTSRKK